MFCYPLVLRLGDNFMMSLLDMAYVKYCMGVYGYVVPTDEHTCS